MSKKTAIDFLYSETKKKLKGQKLKDVLFATELLNEAAKMEANQLLFAFKAGFEYRDSFGWEDLIDFDEHPDHLKVWQQWYEENFVPENVKVVKENGFTKYIMKE